MEDGNDGQATIDEIMLHDEEEDDDMEGHVIMAIDKFGSSTKILLNILLFILMSACFSGILVRCPPIYKRFSQVFSNNEIVSIDFEMTNLTGFNRFLAITGTVNRTTESLNASTIDSNVSVKVCYDCTGRNPEMAVLSNSMHRFSFKKGSVRSSERHFVTDVNKFYKDQTYTIDFEGNSNTVAGVDIRAISLNPKHYRCYLITSFVSVVFMCMAYVCYKMNHKDSMPPECTMVTICVILAIVGSECWQYFISASHPKWVLFVSRACTACLIWVQRFTLYSLAKCHNVMDRSFVGPLEIAIGCVSIVLDVVKEILEVSYYFKWPYGKGDSVINCFRIASVVSMLVWTLFVARRGKRTGAFLCFFGIIWISYVVGIVADGFFGLFKETFFRLYTVFVPVVINTFLLIMTWPVIVHTERAATAQHTQSDHVYQ